MNRIKELIADVRKGRHSMDYLRGFLIGWYWLDKLTFEEVQEYLDEVYNDDFLKKVEEYETNKQV